MLYISICHWAYHSYNIMTWASFQRHKTSQTVQTEPRQGSRWKGFSHRWSIQVWTISPRDLHCCPGYLLSAGEHLEEQICSWWDIQLWSSETWREIKRAPASKAHLCKGERFLVVEEEVVLLLLVVFPYWAAVQQLGHLVLMQWDLWTKSCLKHTWSPYTRERCIAFKAFTT